MNNAKLKSYAPQARKDFIASVTARANQLGISENNGTVDVAPSEKSGDIVLIAGQAWPAKIHQQRERLVQRIQKDGFAHTMEAIAYTWFNRFAALRYMELHDYLDHGHRVLSSREGGLPEILAHASDLAELMPGLNASQVADLKLAGDRDGELYRLLLVAQCNTLSSAMPFLFERIDDESELLLPDNLLRTDSLIRALVEEIPEAEWADIEIIGWLYQFYISEKKDQVIGKVVASEDIPAATQLFTPNWIVKYMVQNSLGAQWLATYPDSPLRGQMAYYIEPAEQPVEVKEQLAAITPSQLDPEELTLIDPACGSGHILVEAYELFKAIYLERGYRQRDVAQLILEKNLYGLDIDERAAQLTGFALMMKGRADDRRLFGRGVKLNVMVLEDSLGFDVDGLVNGVKLADYGLQSRDLLELKMLFEHATTFGSLIQVQEELKEKLPALKELCDTVGEDLFVLEALKRLRPLVQQANLLVRTYDAVVANPPYMGSGYYCPSLKQLVNTNYKAGKADLYGAFTLRNIKFAKRSGRVGMITIPSWLFLSAFESLRAHIVENAPISSLVHNGRGVWGSDFGSCAYVLSRTVSSFSNGRFLRLFDKQGSVSTNDELEKRFHLNPRFTARNSEFKRIPGAPVAYWASSKFLDGFALPKIGSLTKGEGKNVTANNDRFLRFWWEVSGQEVGRDKKWLLYAKGGDFRKWSGNLEYVCNWSEDARSFYRSNNSSRIIDEAYWYLKGITWTVISSLGTGFRFLPADTTFDTKGLALFFQRDEDLNRVLLMFNSVVGKAYLKILNPTFCLNTIDVKAVPYSSAVSLKEVSAQYLIELSNQDWNAYEHSWDFQNNLLLPRSSDCHPTLESCYIAWNTQNRVTIAQMQRLEEENNLLFINAYGLAAELTPEVPIEQITLTVNPAYRYGGNLTEEEQWTRFRKDTIAELVSYAVGCMMGRYSLDDPGLIYAHGGNIGFDATRYKTFHADADGIVPVTDELWFDDDATNRMREFLRAAWGGEHLDQNLEFFAANLDTKGNEMPDETVRRYLANQFFKDHLQAYKRRPIYWLFSSGKQGAFQALVYLHRYNEGTLSRMRAEYVVPLTGKMQSRIEMLEKDRDAASSTAARTKFAKQIESLKKKHVELLAYDEKLRHYADMRIQLDLDDGVKVNYGKFGDLLADVKAVTGGTGDE